MSQVEDIQRGVHDHGGAAAAEQEPAELVLGCGSDRVSVAGYRLFCACAMVAIVEAPTLNHCTQDGARAK